MSDMAAQVAGVRTLLEQAKAAERDAYAKWEEAFERVERLQEAEDNAQQRVFSEAVEHRGPTVTSDDTAQRLRESVRTLARFTMEELATDLQMDKKLVKRLSDELVEQGIIRKAGRYRQSVIYEWIRPTDAGQAFAHQMRMTHVQPAAHRDTTVTTGTGKNSTLNRITDKDVKKFVQDKLSEGWELIDGGKHPMLRKGGRKITVPSTPRDGGNSVNTLRQKLARGA